MGKGDGAALEGSRGARLDALMVSRDEVFGRHTI
jgi:hypothetical protein